MTPRPLSHPTGSAPCWGRTHSPGHHRVQGVVGPEAVQPPTASQPRPAHGVPARVTVRGLGQHQTPSVQPYNTSLPLHPTSFGVFFGGVSPKDNACCSPCPTIAKWGWDGCAQAPLASLCPCAFPPTPCEPGAGHSQWQPVLHGVEPVEALPVNQPVHGVVVDLQERLQGAAGRGGGSPAGRAGCAAQGRGGGLGSHGGRLTG